MHAEGQADGAIEGAPSEDSHHDDVRAETIAAEPAAPAIPEPPAAPPARMNVPELVSEQPVRRRSTIREAPPAYSPEEAAAAAQTPAYVPPAPEPSSEPAQAEAAEKPRRKGWWSLRG